MLQFVFFVLIDWILNNDNLKQKVNCFIYNTIYHSINY